MAKKGHQVLSQELSKKLQFVLSNEEQTDVLLVGEAGAGKSSLINSLISILDAGQKNAQPGIARYIPTAPEEHMGGHTLIREPVELTNKITIIDNRGWHDWENEEALAELVAQIEGERGFDDVSWEGDGAEESFEGGEKVACITVVINGEGGTESLVGFPRLVKTCYKHTGRRPSVVITHKDKMSDEDIAIIGSHLQLEHGISSDRIFCIQNGGVSNVVESTSKQQMLQYLQACIADSISGRSFHTRNEKFKKKAELKKAEMAAAEVIKKKQKNQEEIEELAQEVEMMKGVQAKHRVILEEDSDKVNMEISESMKKAEARKIEIETEAKEKLAKLETEMKVQEVTQQITQLKTVQEIEKQMKLNELERMTAETVKANEMKDLEQKIKLEEHQRSLEERSEIAKMDAKIKYVESERIRVESEKKEAIAELERQMKADEREKYRLELKKQEEIAKIEQNIMRVEQDKKISEATEAEEIATIQKRMKEQELDNIKKKYQKAADIAEIEKRIAQESLERNRIATAKDDDLAKIEKQRKKDAAEHEQKLADIEKASRIESKKKWQENYVEIQKSYFTELGKEKGKQKDS